MIKSNDKRLDPIAFSYLRFSSAKQEEGDSKTRQTRQAEEWAERNEVKIVKRMGDLGLSAWTGKHVKKGELGAFLEMCKTEDFQTICQVRDVYLIVESLDRLSREMILTQVNQLTAIVHAGVIVVTLVDGQVFTPKALNNPASLIIAVTVMARANEESEMKSKRLLSAWKKKRKDAQDGILFSKHIPSWLESIDDKFAKFKPRHKLVRIMRRIFKMASEGVTPFKIARIFNDEKIPTLKSQVSGSGLKGVGWHGKTVKELIQSSAVIGTLTFKAHEEMDDDDIRNVPGYYPAIIDPKLQALALRVLQVNGSDRGKRSPAFVHLFRKFAFCMTTGEPIYTRIGGYTSKGSRGQVYEQTFPWFCYTPRDVRAGMRKGGKWVGRDFEAIFFPTIRLALQVEGSTMRDEAELALNENELEKIQKQLHKIRDLFIASEDDDLDLGIFRSKLIELQAEEKELLTTVEDVKMKIQAGVGKVLIDPAKMDRQKLHEILRSNVERLEMECNERRFKVKLMNGIRYEVRVNEDAGTVKVISDDFQVDDRVKELKA